MREVLHIVHAYDPEYTSPEARQYMAGSAAADLGRKLMEELPKNTWHTIRVNDETRPPFSIDGWLHEYHMWAEVEEVRMRHLEMWEPPPDPYSVRMYRDVKLGDAVRIARRLMWRRVRGMRVRVDPRLALFIGMQIALVIAS